MMNKKQKKMIMDEVGAVYSNIWITTYSKEKSKGG